MYTRIQSGTLGQFQRLLSLVADLTGLLLLTISVIATCWFGLESHRLAFNLYTAAPAPMYVKYVRIVDTSFGYENVLLSYNVTFGY